MEKKLAKFGYSVQKKGQAPIEDIGFWDFLQGIGNKTFVEFLLQNHTPPSLPKMVEETKVEKVATNHVIFQRFLWIIQIY